MKQNIIYLYRVNLEYKGMKDKPYIVTLQKTDSDGNDRNDKIKTIGRYANASIAKDACMKHYEKVCKMAHAANRESPILMFA